MHEHAEHAEHAEHTKHADHGSGSMRPMAVAATLHCLSGCAIGEIAGLVIGTAAGLGNGATIAVSVALAFVFGFTLSSMPLLRAGLPLGTTLGVVVAADTLSIATMEVVDNAVMALLPGAMSAGLVNAVFWVGMMISLAAAFVAAYPVNRFLLERGKGHALTHGYHGAARPEGARRLIPAIRTSTLVAVLLAFMLGGLLVSVADSVGAGGSTTGAPAVGTPTPGPARGAAPHR
jgi:hypothetical protein